MNELSSRLRKGNVTAWAYTTKTTTSKNNPCLSAGPRGISFRRVSSRAASFMCELPAPSVLLIGCPGPFGFLRRSAAYHNCQYEELHPYPWMQTFKSKQSTETQKDVRLQRPRRA